MKIINRYFRNGYSFETALLLSIFLGMFGVDRFYLGYPAIGLAKFCTLGFMFLGQLIDIVLIATQVVGPADGSAYVIPIMDLECKWCAVIIGHTDLDRMIGDQLLVIVRKKSFQ
jgi:TM2 domain-containing membrane protein YozV